MSFFLTTWITRIYSKVKGSLIYDQEIFLSMIWSFRKGSAINYIAYCINAAFPNNHGVSLHFLLIVLGYRRLFFDSPVVTFFLKTVFFREQAAARLTKAQSAPEVMRWNAANAICVSVCRALLAQLDISRTQQFYHNRKQYDFKFFTVQSFSAC